MDWLSRYSSAGLASDRNMVAAALRVVQASELVEQRLRRSELARRRYHEKRRARRAA
jgi:hypothetical protein